MSKETPQVSDLTKALAASLKIEIADGKISAAKDAYAEHVVAGIDRHKGYDGIAKGLSKVLSSESDAVAALDVVKNNTVSLVNALHKADGDFIAAAQYAVGNAVIDHLAANPDLDREAAWTAHIPTVGRNQLEIVYRNDYNKRIPPKEKGGETIVQPAHGRVTAFYDVVGTRKTGEQIVAVRSFLADRAGSIAD